MENVGTTPIPITPRPLGCTVPLAANQTWFWEAVVRRPSRLSCARLCAGSTRLSGILDIQCLQRSIEFVVRRHEALRTRIAVVNAVPTQVIAPPSDVEIPVIDMTSVPSDQRDAEARQCGKDFILQEVDLTAGPLFDGRLLRVSEREHVLILAMDHIVSDAVSCALLSREIWAVYRQLLRRQEPRLAPVNVQFPDLAVWQRDTQESWQRHHLPYWHGKLAGQRSICVPRDYELLDGERPLVEMVHFPMGKSLTSDMREAARKAQCSLPLVFLTLYSAVIARWCRRDELLLAMASHGRSGRPELHGMIGYLGYRIYLRLRFSGTDTLWDLMTQVVAEYSDARSHDASRLRCPDESPTDISFNWMPTASATTRHGGCDESLDDLRVQPFPLSLTMPAKFYSFFYDTPSGVVVTVLYARNLFKEATIRRFGAHMQLLARQFIEWPRTPIVSLPSLP